MVYPMTHLSSASRSKAEWVSEVSRQVYPIAHVMHFSHLGDLSSIHTVAYPGIVKEPLDAECSNSLESPDLPVRANKLGQLARSSSGVILPISTPSGRSPG